MMGLSVEEMEKRRCIAAYTYTHTCTCSHTSKLVSGAAPPPWLVSIRRLTALNPLLLPLCSFHVCSFHSVQSICSLCSIHSRRLHTTVALLFLSLGLPVCELARTELGSVLWWLSEWWALKVELVKLVIDRNGWVTFSQKCCCSSQQQPWFHHAYNGAICSKALVHKRLFSDAIFTQTRLMPDSKAEAQHCFACVNKQAVGYLF